MADQAVMERSSPGPLAIPSRSQPCGCRGPGTRTTEGTTGTWSLHRGSLRPLQWGRGEESVRQDPAQRGGLQESALNPLLPSARHSRGAQARAARSGEFSSPRLS